MSLDPVNFPPHYSGPTHVCGAAIECIDITRHHNFLRGNVIKYLWRADSKGHQLQDLKKAAWYLAQEIAEVEQAIADRERADLE